MQLNLGAVQLEHPCSVGILSAQILRLLLACASYCPKGRQQAAVPIGILVPFSWENSSNWAKCGQLRQAALPHQRKGKVTEVARKWQCCFYTWPPNQEGQVGNNIFPLIPAAPNILKELHFIHGFCQLAKGLNSYNKLFRRNCLPDSHYELYRTEELIHQIQLTSCYKTLLGCKH